MPTGEHDFKCVKCKKMRPKIVGGQTFARICLRCQLFGVVLMRSFDGIASTTAMQEFKAEMTEWYLNDV